MLDIKQLLMKITQFLSKVGTYKSDAPSAKSCATSKYYELANLTLEPGVWHVDVSGYFPATNTTGYRAIRVTAATSGYNNVTDPPAAIGNISIDNITAANRGQYAHSHFPRRVSGDSETIRLIGWQNSGSTVNVTGRMYAIRIK